MISLGKGLAFHVSPMQESGDDAGYYLVSVLYSTPDNGGIIGRIMAVDGKFYAESGVIEDDMSETACFGAAVASLIHDWFDYKQTQTTNLPNIH